MLFTDPRNWSKSAVGSWWRFCFMVIAMSGLSVYAVFVAAESGFRSGLIVALMPIMFQVFFLYALRRMYHQATGEEGATSAV
jgi:hypothetical protein